MERGMERGMEGGMERGMEGIVAVVTEVVLEGIVAVTDITAAITVNTAAMGHRGLRRDHSKRGEGFDRERMRYRGLLL